MQQLNLSGLPDIPIRVFVFVVFALSTWASLASGWIGLGYMFSNYFVVLLGIWTERDSSEAVPVQLLFFGLLFTFLNDILSISITYERAIDSVEGWAAGTSNVRFNAATRSRWKLRRLRSEAASLLRENQNKEN